MSPRTDAETCWICRSPRTDLYRSGIEVGQLTPHDMQITDRRYGVTVTLRRCKRCGFIFADGDDVDCIGRLYEGLVDVEYEAGAEVRSVQMGKILDMAVRMRPKATSLLDIGAGIGLLVGEARRRGLQAEGVEPSTWATDVAKTQFGLEIHNGILPHPAIEGRTFDIITLVDVIEHVCDPVGMLRLVRSHLAPGGIAVIITPDVGSIAARLLGRRWWHFRVAHVGYFSRSTMLRALDEAGLTQTCRRRATWYFTLEYLAERVAVYAGVLHPLIRRLRGARLMKWTVRLNLRDSWCFIAQTGDAS